MKNSGHSCSQPHVLRYKTGPELGFIRPCKYWTPSHSDQPVLDIRVAEPTPWSWNSWDELGWISGAISRWDGSHLTPCNELDTTRPKPLPEDTLDLEVYIIPPHLLLAALTPLLITITPLSHHSSYTGEPFFTNKQTEPRKRTTVATTYANQNVWPSIRHCRVRVHRTDRSSTYQHPHGAGNPAQTDRHVFDCHASGSRQLLHLW